MTTIDESEAERSGEDVHDRPSYFPDWSALLADIGVLVVSMFRL